MGKEHQHFTGNKNHICQTMVEIFLVSVEKTSSLIHFLKNHCIELKQCAALPVTFNLYCVHLPIPSTSSCNLPAHMWGAYTGVDGDGVINGGIDCPYCYLLMLFTVF
ncbi:UNVERIFIED_CONTAM: hypothetical protein K2H54_033738 [Gekko kuhli]